jgi:hypothetical protein
MPDVDLGEVTRSLYARRHEAVTVPFEMHSVTSGSPLEHDCHRNVDRFVLEHPDHKPVRGWLVLDFNKSSQGWWPFCQFTAHSVVEAPDGRLIDLTPSQASQRYPFLRHQGPEGQFEAIVLAGHIHLECAIGLE